MGCSAFCKRATLVSNKVELSNIPGARQVISLDNNMACDIAKTQGTSQAAMSKMIDGLVAKGFVKREANIDDRRHFHLNLTSIGDAFFKKTRKHAQANLKEQISCLDEQDRDDLTRGLIALEKLFLSARAKDN